MRRLTYLDPGVLIHAWLGLGDAARRAVEIIDDPDRDFLTCDFVDLELLPTTIYHRDDAQRAYYEAFLSTATPVNGLERIIKQAFAEGASCGVAGIDACHLGAAVLGEADELVTAEKPTKPICRSKSVPVVSIRWAGP